MAAIHFDDGGTWQADVADVFRLGEGGQGIQILLVEKPVVAVGVDSEIAYSEGCQVLEEVGALAWVHAIVLQAAFHDDAGLADVGPFHGNAEPGIAAAPTAGR